MQRVGEWFHNHGIPHHRQETSYDGYDYVEPSGLNVSLIVGTLVLFAVLVIGAVVS